MKESSIHPAKWLDQILFVVPPHSNLAKHEIKLGTCLPFLLRLSKISVPTLPFHVKTEKSYFNLHWGFKEFVKDNYKFSKE